MDDIPYAPKLRTNYAATEQDMVQLEKFLVDATAKLAKLQEEIDRVHALHIDLCAQREALCCSIDEHRALVAPIRRLPIDIIQEIFLQCLPTEHNPVMSRHECPMLLTQICSNWRRISHSSPSLWASIHVVIPGEAPQYAYSNARPPSGIFPCFEVAHNRANGLKEWLQRSGACPLNISVHDDQVSEVQLNEPFEEIIGAVIEFSHRWETVDFQIPPLRLGTIAAMSEQDFPILRSLWIAGKRGRFPDFISHGISLGQLQENLWTDSGLLKAPLLNQISYSGDENLAGFPLKWTHLTSLSLISYGEGTMQAMSFLDIAHTLRSCLALVHCTLDVRELFELDDTDTVQVANIPTITLHSLQKLSVQGPTWGLCSLFNALEVISLRELKIFPASNGLSQSLSIQLYSSLARIAPALQSITMHPFLLRKPQLFQLIQLCSCVTILRLKQNLHYPGWDRGSMNFPVDAPDDHRDIYYVIDDELLRGLITPVHGGQLLLPNLKTLEATCFTPDISDLAILELVRAKCSNLPGVVALERIALTMNRNQMVESMIEELRPFVRGGLDCRISYTPTVQPGPYPMSAGIPTDSSSIISNGWKPNVLLQF